MVVTSECQIERLNCLIKIGCMMVDKNMLTNILISFMMLTINNTGELRNEYVKFTKPKLW